MHCFEAPPYNGSSTTLLEGIPEISGPTLMAKVAILHEIVDPRNSDLVNLLSKY